MVDISAKARMIRSAKAYAEISMQHETIQSLTQGLLHKGDALACAHVAGILAAKKTSELIPLCHTVAIDQITLEFQINEKSIGIMSQARCTEKTGIEMEALTAVSVAALTLYDMCKAVDKTMCIHSIHLAEKVKTAIE